MNKRSSPDAEVKQQHTLVEFRPGSELQFFPWISENRNTNLVIKKMIKSF